MMNSRMMEDVVVIGGLIGVQFVYAGNAMLLKFLMSLGLQSFTIVIFTSFTTFLLLLPFVLYFERYFLPIFFSFYCCFFEMGLWRIFELWWWWFLFGYVSVAGVNGLRRSLSSWLFNFSSLLLEGKEILLLLYVFNVFTHWIVFVNVLIDMNST